MTQDLDAALRQLASVPAHPGLASIEDAVLNRVHSGPTTRHPKGLGIGAIAALGALLLGIATGGPLEASPSPGTLSPFGPSSPLAPSTLLLASR